LKISFQGKVKIERIAETDAKDQADGIAAFENELVKQFVITEKRSDCKFSNFRQSQLSQADNPLSHDRSIQRFVGS
jgi:hypothetical protein